MRINTLLKCGVACAILIGCFGSLFFLMSKRYTHLDIIPLTKNVLQCQEGEMLVNVTSNVIARNDRNNSVDINTENKYDVMPTTDQTVEERMQEQMQLAFVAFEIDPKSEILSDTMKEDMIISRTMRAIRLNDGKYLAFDAVSGELLHYISFVQETVPNRLTKRDAISQDKAIAIAQQILERLGIRDGFDFEKVYYNKIGGTDGLGDSDKLTGGEWSLHGSQKYAGIPYFLSGIHIRLSAYSGIVLAYANDPIGPPPESLDERITADKASSIASDFLGIGFLGFLNGVHIRQPQKVIACSNSYFTFPEQRPIVQGKKSYLCWNIIVDNLNDLPLTVIVNASTGEIIGGI